MAAERRRAPAALSTALVIGMGIGVVAGVERAGVPPAGPWACPESHPIKGYESAASGGRVYFPPSHRFYDEASPARCYATEEEARTDGAVPAREPRPARPPSEELG